MRISLPPCQVDLYDVSGPHGASMRAIPLLEERGAPTPVDLQDALPLSAFLAPVAESKEALSAAVEALEPSEAGRSCALHPSACGVFACTMLSWHKVLLHP